MLIKKHRIISLVGLPGTNEIKTTACVVEENEEFNLEQILKCGMALTSAGRSGAINFWLDDSGNICGEFMNNRTIIESLKFDSIEDAELCALKWIYKIN